MPRVKNELNYKHDVSDKSLVIESDKIVKATKTGNWIRKASKKYESKLEQLTVRLPLGSREIINNYVASSKKYDSANAMIKALLEKEIGQKFD